MKKIYKFRFFFFFFIRMICFCKKPLNHNRNDGGKFIGVNFFLFFLIALVYRTGIVVSAMWGLFAFHFDIIQLFMSTRMPIIDPR